jgi:hypothetical protein
MNLAMSSWKPSEHKWTIAGAALTLVSMALIVPGIAFTGVELGDGLDARPGYSLLGAGLFALVTAIGMVIYNATL